MVVERLYAAMGRQWDAVAMGAAAARQRSERRFVVEVKGPSCSGSECCCSSTRKKGTEL
jgi:hypothetical protein